jgi:hypothetical protein
MYDQSVWGAVPEPTGSQSVIAVGPEAIGRAVDALSQVPGAAELNIRAGEHLAGLVLTAFNGPPSVVDTDGGLDFAFRRQPAGWPWSFGIGNDAAVEVKSSPGPFRHRESKMVIGDGLSVPVVSVVDLLQGCSGLLTRAVAALERKAEPGWSRHVFLVMHPFDGFAVEPFHNYGLAADKLPALNLSVRVDTLWCYFHSLGSIVCWSSTERRWTNMMFAGWSPADGPEPDDLVEGMEQAEELFFERIGHQDGSPWLFEVESEDS